MSKRATLFPLLAALCGCGLNQYAVPVAVQEGASAPGAAFSFIPVGPDTNPFTNLAPYYSLWCRYGLAKGVDVGLSTHYMNFYDTQGGQSVRLTSFALVPGARYATGWKFLRAMGTLDLGAVWGALHISDAGGRNTIANNAYYVTPGFSGGVALGPVVPYVPFKYTYGITPGLKIGDTEFTGIGYISYGFGVGVATSRFTLASEMLIHDAGPDPDKPSERLLTASFGIGLTVPIGR